jgi:hypothetical protein
VKISVKLAHEIQNRLQLVVGHIENGLTTLNSKGTSAVEIRKAKVAALGISKLVKDQTVKAVENCEACGHYSATLETKRENK